jgi:hypothetical protein
LLSSVAATDEPFEQLRAQLERSELLRRTRDIRLKRDTR